MVLGERLAEFGVPLVVRTIPGETLERARLALLTPYGVALARLTTPCVPVARRAAIAAEGVREGGATMHANGALVHGRAQEGALGGSHIGPVGADLNRCAIARVPLAERRAQLR